MDGMNLNTPVMAEALQDGADDSKIKEVLGIKLPNDVTESYRIHNGSA